MNPAQQYGPHRTQRELANMLPPGAGRPGEVSDPPWWVYVLVVAALILLAPLVIVGAAVWWVAKALGVVTWDLSKVAALPLYPHRTPARYRNHGRSS